MNRLYSLVAALLITTAALAQTAPADPTQDPTAAGNAFFKALLDEDSGTLSKVLTSDFNITSFDGSSVDGDLLQQGVSGGIVIIETGTVSEARTRQYNSDSAVMTGSWKVKGNIQGQALDASAAFSALCVKQGTSWKIANVQFTPIRQ